MQLNDRSINDLRALKGGTRPLDELVVSAQEKTRPEAAFHPSRLNGYVTRDPTDLSSLFPRRNHPNDKRSFSLEHAPVAVKTRLTAHGDSPWCAAMVTVFIRILTI